MTRAVTVIRRTTVGVFAAGAAFAAISLPAASADPVEPAEPTTPAVVPAPDDCNAAGLAKTISSVTGELNVYFAAHPDANQALIDAARQPAFAAVGQFDDYFKEHPDEADTLRGIQAPLSAFKDRCGLQVAPTDALAVLAEV
ncbi:hemophore-related protein [Mycolicibacterium sp.]|uniref:hemophore-related protein n=1 Tax=Mycolicibacterium sp. TaxID=2320850 RepID=UPI001A1ACF54|nr:hemophore-related protein [Mycolicibacterium sp.]MBJ7337684.1 heme-binding protein [Mycolicibacterium sp.]